MRDPATSTDTGDRLRLGVGLMTPWRKRLPVISRKDLPRLDDVKWDVRGQEGSAIQAGEAVRAGTAGIGQAEGIEFECGPSSRQR